MTKSKLQKKKIIPFIAILTSVLLGMFNLNSVSALEWEGEGVTFELDDDHPTQYGAFIPTPNMFTTMFIDASNQGRYAMMDWRGVEVDSELVDFPGANISHLYPWYFDHYVKATPTNNDYIDPWDIDWMNVTAYNPHSVTLSSYTLNSTFDYHVLIEGNTLNVPVRNRFPIQIDLVIKSQGPKVLKFDWLTDNSAFSPINNWALITPSGKLVDTYSSVATYDGIEEAYDESECFFRYTPFVALEKGTYRLLVDASHPTPMRLSLEFINTPVTNLQLNKLTFGGNTNDDPNLQEVWDIEWQNNWYRIKGEKNDIFKLEIGCDFGDTLPTTYIWYPCENGYVGNYVPSPESYEIIFPATGSIYISFIDDYYSEWYRYSLYLSELEHEIVDYQIGDPLTTLKVNNKQRKVIEFEIEQPSFIEFNFTSYTQPMGNPIIYANSTEFAFYYEDSNKITCLDIVECIDKKTYGSEDFYYYYFPNGTYKAVIANQDERYNGVFQIDSKYVDFLNTTIPITSLDYPDTNVDPSQFLTMEFEQDEYYNSSYEAKYVYINITAPGQYVLNFTIDATEYSPLIYPLQIDPISVVVYNESAGTYHDWTEEAQDPSKSFPAFSDDGGDEDNDILFIGYPEKSALFDFYLSIPGYGGSDLDGYMWDGSIWQIDYLVDTSYAFSNNGTLLLSTGSNYQNWVKGVGGIYNFDVPNINESQYYWLGIANDGGNYWQLPYIQTITSPDNPIIIPPKPKINLALVGDSKYDYCDFWEPIIAPELEFTFSNETLKASQEGNLFETNNPYIIGLEPGLYKLLIIPRLFLNYSEPITIDFAIENHWSYRRQRTYNISALSPTPNLYMRQIQNYTAANYGEINGTMYNYGLITQYNDTMKSISISPANQGYFVMKCYGDAYQWTQLVVCTNNVSSYNLYLMQDLPWIDNTGPNDEIKEIALSVSVNRTFEFGVHRDIFYLIFEVDELDDLVTFRVALSQYDTTLLDPIVPIASYTPPFELGPLGLGLIIVIPVGAGIIVLIYVLKKKGRL